MPAPAEEVESKMHNLIFKTPEFSFQLMRTLGHAPGDPEVNALWELAHSCFNEAIKKR